jgi:hypothetical protein
VLHYVEFGAGEDGRLEVLEGRVSWECVGVGGHGRADPEIGGQLSEEEKRELTVNAIF